MRNISYNALLAIGLIWLVLEFFALGPLSYFEMHDNGDSSLSAIAATAPSFLEKPLWYPYGGGGTDRYSLGYFGGFETFLYWALPDWLAGILLSIAPAVLGGIFTYLFSKRILGLTASAAVFAGLGVALFSATGKFYESTAGLLPFILWSIHRGLDEGLATWKRWCWLILPSLFYGMITHIQLLPFALFMGFIWFLLQDVRRPIGDWVKIIISLAVPLVPRLQDIFSLAMLSGDSHRTKWASLSEPLSIGEHLNNVFNSLFSLNEITFFVLLGIWGWICVLRGRAIAPSSMKAVSAGIIFILIFPIFYDMTKPLFLNYFPFLANMHFRLGVSLPLFAVLFGAFGAQILTIGKKANGDESSPAFQFSLKHREGRAFIGLLAILIAFSIPPKLRHAYDWVVNGNYLQNFSNPLIEEFVRDHPLDAEPYRVASFQMFPSPLQSYGLETAGGYMPFYSSRYHDFWQRVVLPLERKNPERAGIFGSWGSRFNLSANIREPELNLGDYYDLDLLSLANVRYVFSRDRLTDNSFNPLVEAAQPWNTLGRKEKALKSIKANLGGKRDFYIYENKKALPRFYLAGRARTFSTVEAILEAISAASTDELRKTVFVMDGSIPAGFSEAEREVSGSITMTTYESDRITLDVTTDGPAVLAVLNNYSPYWRCIVNGKEVTIVPSYHTFWGIPLEGGEFSIEFSYDPPWRF